MFDAVGTLIFPEPSVAAVYQRIAAEFGLRISRNELGARFGSAMTNARSFRRLEQDGQTSEAAEVDFWRAVVTQVLAGVPTENIEAAFQRLWQHFAEAAHWQLFDDIAPTLTELRRRGYRIGVASNFDSRLIGICKELWPLDQISDEDQFVSSRVGWVKPADGFYGAIQQATQLEPARILMVGDDFENDVAAPHRCGWLARWLVRNSAESTGEHIRSLTDLLAELP
ncbi:HAD-IA family hydrolase [Anatilimnocola floriformis]|uniref:HAD-IA family hydrolase n=1 Tax=Anatilimnocola floriformis TaxID=2948575 RepID=UPI0020C2DAFB|nr:HAD-IA family hydrolase [Anatilimnocola floriformis]